MRARLSEAAYLEFKVTKQISTGNGETYLAQSERPPGGFVMVELGEGINERPCSDCHRPCTLGYTLGNLEEINRRNIRDGQVQDPDRFSDRQRERYNVPKPQPQLTAAEKADRKRHKHRRSPADDARAVRAALRRSGIRVIGGQYVDERPRTWMPTDPNGENRRRELREARAKAKAVKAA